MKLAVYTVALFCLLTFGFNAGQARTIHFAGVDWYVKNGGPYGPGPNYWSDSGQSVWVDAQGRLHLTIRQENGLWYCSEVYTVKKTTYGEHRFLVDGWLDRMDKNIIFGLFIYANDAAEIDIEYSKWGYENKENVGSYTVQPYSTPGNQYTFKSPLDSSKTTHFFNWQPSYVMFGSMHGHYYGAPPSQNYYIAQWVYSGDDNPSDLHNLHTHINFWLNNGEAPQNLSVLEVIITDVIQPLNTSLIETSNRVPGTILLRQNYPNPFNGKTVIRYSVKGAGAQPVNLSVYGLNGKLVGTLVNGIQKSGSYSVVFNGDRLSSGIYWYRLKVGSIVKIKKMILLR